MILDSLFVLNEPYNMNISMFLFSKCPICNMSTIARTDQSLANHVYQFSYIFYDWML